MTRLPGFLPLTASRRSIIDSRSTSVEPFHGSLIVGGGGGLGPSGDSGLFLLVTLFLFLDNCVGKDVLAKSF